MPSEMVAECAGIDIVLLAVWTNYICGNYCYYSCAYKTYKEKHAVGCTSFNTGCIIVSI